VQDRTKQLKEYAEEMRKLYMRLGTVEEDERRLLHRELHDRIGANLSALGLAARSDRRLAFARRQSGRRGTR
jgi:glucose-6-phosphate-specific signal transduction histidine kinase